MVNKISEAHKEQIRSMRKDGKKYYEIRDFFQQNYKMKIFDCSIARACKGANIKIKTKKTPALKKKIISLRETPPLPVDTDAPEDSEEFVNHIHAAFNIYKKGFLERVKEIVVAL